MALFFCELHVEEDVVQRFKELNKFDDSILLCIQADVHGTHQWSCIAHGRLRWFIVSQLPGIKKDSHLELLFEIVANTSEVVLPSRFDWPLFSCHSSLKEEGPSQGGGHAPLRIFGGRCYLAHTYE